MEKKSTKINTIRGERLKILLSEKGISQKDLAEKIGYTKEHVSYIVNGRRNLTADAAELIVKLFSPVRFEWLMGYDDFKTNADFESAPLKKMISEICDKRILFSALLFSLGYDKSVLDHSKHADLTFSDIKNMGPIDIADHIVEMSHDLDKIEYQLTKNGKEIGRCSVYEYESLIDDVFDFLEFKIRKICERGSNNG